MKYYFYEAVDCNAIGKKYYSGVAEIENEVSPVDVPYKIISKISVPEGRANWRITKLNKIDEDFK